MPGAIEFAGTPSRLRPAEEADLKFHLATASGNFVTGVGPGWVRVNGDVHRQGLVVFPDALVTPWASAGFDGLGEADFASLLGFSPAIVVFGTGPVQRFADPRLTRALTDSGIGIETMDTAAACRTYNVLASEGRRVAAALIVDAPRAAAAAGP
jgi:uncharacterized protein